MPILKGRMGELEALSNMGAERQGLTPLIEVVPSSTDDLDPQQAQTDIRKFAERLESRWRSDGPVILDAGLFPEGLFLSGGTHPVVSLARDVRARGIRSTPVARPSDGETAWDAVREAVEDDPQTGACLRLGADDIDDDEAPIEDVIQGLLDRIGATSEMCDVVVDFGMLPEDGGQLAPRMARYLLNELPPLEWRTLTLASGAFPTSLTAITPFVVGDIPRLDWLLWTQVVTRRSRVRLPGYGDYAIANPVIAQGAAFAPAPQIRYTADEVWLVMRGRKGVRRGPQQFYDICEHLVARPEYTGADFSWGDRKIWEAAMSAPEGATPVTGPGNATTWRSIGTSHHLAFVVNRLANLS